MGNSELESSLGLVFVIAFPLILFVICLANRDKEMCGSIVVFALSGRSFSTIQASCTMISTWVCGGYLFGSVESVVTEGRGLLWTQTFWAFAISFVLNSVVFCDKLYEKDYITLFDPICRKFGPSLSLLLYVPSLLGDLMWIAMSFSILKNFIPIVIGLDTDLILVFIGASVALIAIIGGMTSQKYTGCICFCLMVIILVLILVLLPSNEHVNNIRDYRSNWMGVIPSSSIGTWIDELLLIVFGGTCWQVYYQQMLACRSSESGYVMSIISGFGTMFLGLVACFIGIFVSTVDWSQFSAVGSIQGKESNILSYTIKYLLSPEIQPFCVLLVLATSIGSLLSSVFSSATVFSMNVYKEIIRKEAVDKEVLLVWRLVIVMIVAVSLFICYYIQHIYSVFLFTSELMYIFVFPQLLLSVWLPSAVNAYGCLFGFFTGLVSRLSCGVEVLGWQAWWEVPSGFPFRLMSVLAIIIVEIVVSWFFQFLIYSKGYIMFDFLSVFSTTRVYSPVKGGRLRSHSLKIVEI